MYLHAICGYVSDNVPSQLIIEFVRVHLTCADEACMLHFRSNFVMLHGPRALRAKYDLAA